MTPTEALQAICEAWNRLDNDALADLFTDDGVFEDPLHERAPARAARTSAPSTRPAMAVAERVRGHAQRGRRARRSRALPRACSARRSPTAARAWTSRSRWSSSCATAASRGSPSTSTPRRSYERASAARAREPLSYTVRRSPYFERTLAAGAIGFMVYNHTYMPIDYGRDPPRRVPGAHRGRDALGRRRRAAGAAARPGRAELRRLPQPARPARSRASGAAASRRSAIRAARSWPTASCCGRSRTRSGTRTRIATSRCGPTGSRSRAARASRWRRPTSRRCSCRARSPRPCSSRSTTAISRRCAASTARAVDVAGVPCVVSNTGWSKEAGYEIYPLGSQRCLELWDALVAAGEPHGLLVTGPNITRAVEQGITDTQYKMNSGMTALEAGLESMLQLDGDDFMGREALVAERARGSAPPHDRPGGRRRAVPVPRGLLARARRRRQRRSASPAGRCSPTRSSRTSRSRSWLRASGTPTSSWSGRPTATAPRACTRSRSSERSQSLR